MKIRGQLIKDPKLRIKNLSEVDAITGCWNWKSSLVGKSKLSQYGHLIVGSRTDKTRRSVRAHRYSHEIFIGKIPKGLWVLHKCDNPKCVNPKHLFLGNRQDNVDDRERKGRNKLPRLRAENHPNAKLNWKIIFSIRERYNAGESISVIAKDYTKITTRRYISDIVHLNVWKPSAPEKSE